VSPPFDGSSRATEHRAVSAKKNGIQRSQIQTALWNLWKLCAESPSAPFESAALPVVAALALAAERSGGPTLEKLGKTARATLRAGNANALAPLRHEVVRALVAAAGRKPPDRFKNVDLAHFLSVDLTHLAHTHLPMVGALAHKSNEWHSTAGLFNRVLTEVRAALEKSAGLQGKRDPSEDLAVATLVAWGFDRGNARKIVQDTMRHAK